MIFYIGEESIKVVLSIMNFVIINKFVTLD